MLRRLRLWRSLGLCCALSPHLHAGEIVEFLFDYSGNNIAASGILTTEATTETGQYLITGISGERNNVDIVGLDLSFGDPDEILYYPATDTGTALVPTYLDNSGLSFDTEDDSYNIFTSSFRPAVVENDMGPEISFSISPAPEPPGFGLFVIGMIGLVVVAHFRWARISDGFCKQSAQQRKLADPDQGAPLQP